MEQTTSRRHWARITLTLPPETADALAVIARDNYRDRRREALRLLTEGIAREARRQPESAR